MVQSQGPKSLTIGRLAGGGNVGVETIRFYQRKGLLETPTRESGIRRYGSEDLRRLRFIRQAQAAGFTLEEIRELLELDAGEDRDRARELARSRIEALDAKIAELGVPAKRSSGWRPNAVRGQRAPVRFSARSGSEPFLRH